MSRTPRIPSLRRHRPSGQGVVTLNGKDYYLGKWPADEETPPPLVKTAYDQKIAEWLAAGRRLPIPDQDGQEEDKGPTVADLLAAFWVHVEEHYRLPDGTPSNEIADYRLSLRPLRHLYGNLPANEFTQVGLSHHRRVHHSRADGQRNVDDLLV
jgi:hypothetical protein